MSKNPIGGYFELERLGGGGNFPHSQGVLLNTGRNALEYIILSIGNVNKVYIPYYTCEVVLEPLTKLNIKYKFYRIDQNLEIADDLNPQDSEYILYTNYFGIKDEYVQKLSIQYGDHLIVDCAQALYAKHIKEIKTFYSPRKFVGIPDGAVAYSDDAINPLFYGVDESEVRMSHLYLRKEKGSQAGYADFKANSKKLVMQPIKLMSQITNEMIDNIDFDEIKARRIQNFRKLHETLKATNKFVVPDMESFECPMVYPYWTDDESLKQRLISEWIFVATYWPNVLEWTRSDMIEYEFANNLLAIPCDQRYGETEMNRIIELICK